MIGINVGVVRLGFGSITSGISIWLLDTGFWEDADQWVDTASWVD